VSQSTLFEIVLIPPFGGVEQKHPRCIMFVLSETARRKCYASKYQHFVSGHKFTRKEKILIASRGRYSSRQAIIC